MPRTAYLHDQPGNSSLPYSPVVRIGSTIHTAGQVGETVDGEMLTGFEAQARQALENVKQVLSAAGATLDDVIRVGIYLSSFKHFETLNRVYREFFTAPFPARTTVVVGLPEGFLIEIDALAVVEKE